LQLANETIEQYYNRIIKLIKCNNSKDPKINQMILELNHHNSRSYWYVITIIKCAKKIWFAKWLENKLEVYSEIRKRFDPRFRFFSAHHTIQSELRN